MRARSHLLRALVAAGFLAAASGAARAEEGPSVAAALAAFRLADPALEIEIAAAEPEVLDPVALAWDEDERLYVAEMRDYPAGPAGGTIRLLEDADGDGRYERASLFAEGLPFPASVLAWNGGLLVAAAPDILFFKDADGDGRAEERRVLLTGFAEGNQQLRVNSLTWGIDGRIYAANGRSGGAVRAPGAPAAEAVSIARNDLRFDPRALKVEPLLGPSQFGLAFDDFGNRFLSWNTVPIRHAALEERYLARGAAGVASGGIAEILEPEDGGRVFPLAPAQRRFNRETVEFFNASCGLAICRGDAIPELRGDAFVCEPLTSLVHRRKLVPKGATFAALRAEEGREFLASTDPWFRPVNLATGPDGALYVADFCREWVEHPDFVPEHLRASVDFTVGKDRGRIWRIRKKGAPRAHRRIRMSAASGEDLVRYLNDPDGWRRDAAQRLIVQRADPQSARTLAALIENPDARPEARLAALWTAAALNRAAPGALADAMLWRCLTDADPRVRRGAIAVLEEAPAPGENLIRQLSLLAEDPDPGVRFQLAAVAGGFPAALQGKLLETLASGDLSDPWLRLAIAASAGGRAAELLAALAREPGPVPVRGAAAVISDEPRLALLGLLARSAPQLNPGLLFRPFHGRAEQIAVLSGWAEANELAGADARASFAGAYSEAERGLRAELLAAARAAARDADAPPEARLRALRVVGLDASDGARDALLQIAEAREESVAGAAIRALLRGGGEPAAQGLLARWGALSVSGRRAAAAALAQTPAGAEALLAAAEAGAVSRMDLKIGAGEALANHPDAALRARAAAFFGSAAAGGRAEVAARYAPALALEGDAARGAAHFARNCLACHRMQGVGQSVGPDLSGIASRAKEKLLSDILDPSAEIAPDYANYIAATRRGEVVSGLLARESPAGVVLRGAQGIETAIPAAELAELRAGNLSLMPEGFEDALDAQAMADLLRFLQFGERDAL